MWANDGRQWSHYITLCLCTRGRRGKKYYEGELKKKKSSSNLAWRLDDSELSRRDSLIHLAELPRQSFPTLRGFRKQPACVWSRQNEDSTAARWRRSSKRKKNRNRKQVFLQPWLFKSTYRLITRRERKAVIGKSVSVLFGGCECDSIGHMQINLDQQEAVNTQLHQETAKFM